MIAWLLFLVIILGLHVSPAELQAVLQSAPCAPSTLNESENNNIQLSVLLWKQIIIQNPSHLRCCEKASFVTLLYILTKT